jgi:hypothetical protein
MERIETVAIETVAARRRNQVMNAIKACGTVITVGPLEFCRILSQTDNPLIVFSKGGLLSKHYKYLTSYRGLAFYCKTPTPLEIPADAELSAANMISIPDL